MSAPDTQTIRRVFADYCRYLAVGDADGLADLFAADGYIEDPIGTPRHHGRDAVRAFFQTGFDNTGGRILFEPEGALRICGAYAAGAFIATCDRMQPPMRVETLDIAEFDSQGRIRSMTAVLGPTNFHQLT